MDISDENEENLVSMGFSRSDVKRALKKAKNDMNEAVDLLTNGHMLSGCYDDPEADVEQLMDVEDQRDFPLGNLYELESRVLTENWSIPYRPNESLAHCLRAATRLLLEGRASQDEHCCRFLDKVFPEAFHKLLTSGAVHRWNAETLEGVNEMCMLMVDLMAQCISVLATPPETADDGPNVVSSAPAVLQLLPTSPVVLLEVLAVAFNRQSEFHVKNAAKRADTGRWDDVFGMGNWFAVWRNMREPYGWLVNMVNRFAELKGFEHIRDILLKGTADIAIMAAVLQPVACCADFLNAEVARPLFKPALKKVTDVVEALTTEDFKSKHIGKSYELLLSAKIVCSELWQEHAERTDQLRLDLALRMLKCSHFNAKMNALIEVTRMIDDATMKRDVRGAFTQQRLLSWMCDVQLLTVLMDGNVDHAQYCERAKRVVQFLVPRLARDDVVRIWSRMERQTSNVIDNIHGIFAAAAARFTNEQFDMFVVLLSETWSKADEKMQERLIVLLGRIGRDTKTPDIAMKVVDELWRLAHHERLSRSLTDKAIEEQYGVLADSSVVKDSGRKQHVSRCVEDVRKGVCVVVALRLLLDIIRNMAKNSFNKGDKVFLQELNRNSDLVKLLVTSLVKCHQRAVAAACGEPLLPSLLVDGRYTHQEYVDWHLTCLQFVLQDGVVNLSWNRAKDLWECLILNPSACLWDQERCYEWFTGGIKDLEPDALTNIFTKELLTQSVTYLSYKGFDCWCKFFEQVNLSEGKLKKKSAIEVVVEKMDLVGIEELWTLCLSVLDENIAQDAISLMLKYIYVDLSPKLKRDAASLHRRFIEECHGRLEALLVALRGGGSALYRALSQALACAAVPVIAPAMERVPQQQQQPLLRQALAAGAPLRATHLLHVERLLQIVERYVMCVEEVHSAPRTILPHGATYLGLPLGLRIECGDRKQTFTVQGFSNEPLQLLRQRIGQQLNVSPEHVQIMLNDVVSTNRDQRLLSQLGLTDGQKIAVQVSAGALTSSHHLMPIPVPASASATNVSASSSAASCSSSAAASSQSSGAVAVSAASTASSAGLSSGGAAAASPSKFNLEFEHEKALPGVMMSQGGQVFKLLYQLAEIGEVKITRKVTALLHLIPTDPSVLEVIDNYCEGDMNSGSALSTPTVSPIPSPRKMPPPALPTSMRKISKDKLNSLFDLTSPEMSPFRILYNLEALSSRMMPNDAREIGQGEASGRNMLRDESGLQLVVQMLDVDFLPTDIDYGTRQACLTISLQLMSNILTGRSPAVANSTSVAGPLTEDLPNVLQGIELAKFTDMIARLMRLSWAAAAGRLHLSGSVQPTKDAFGRTRQSSAGSNASSGSEGTGDVQCLHAGVCLQQPTVDNLDTNIACQALRLLLTCLRMRFDYVAAFYSLPCIADYIVDILAGCSREEVRQEACDLFLDFALSTTGPAASETKSSAAGARSGTASAESPRHFLLRVLLQARLPYWVTNCATRGARQRLLSHCLQYFELRCRLLADLSVAEQRLLEIDVASMLEDEVAWLTNFVPSAVAGSSLPMAAAGVYAASCGRRVTARQCANSAANDALLTGHLRLVRAILTCEGVDGAARHGQALVQLLLADFLFPAAKLESMQEKYGSLADFSPKCCTPASQLAAYDVLRELSRASPQILRDVCLFLHNAHHQKADTTEWEYMPPVEGRAACGFVGLKNGGATCYMNAVIQQLFMTPGVAEGILNADEEGEAIDEKSVLYQMQLVVGHLLASQLQYFAPEDLWRVFRLWGHEAVNVREQHDAFDFFTALTDQLDEALKRLGREELFKKKFQGVFSDQKVCIDCPHRYEREEPFLALNLTVKAATLEDSLSQFVKGEILEGDNAYLCEKCEKKRNTMKRTSIKVLPPMLCIHLKRFSFDWEANRALKFDDYFKFPRSLNMAPYTAAALSSLPPGSGAASGNEQAVPAGGGGPGVTTAPGAAANGGACASYELMGVVVHTGQASAGHYYAYIRDHRGTQLSNDSHGRWFKFNDTSIDEFQMTDEAMEAECFGGKYKAKVIDQGASLPEDRVRYWNAYLLFYERVDELPRGGGSGTGAGLAATLPARRSRVASLKRASQPPALPSLPSGAAIVGVPGRSSDSLSELSELVQQSERHAVFSSHMPAHVQQCVRHGNLQFLRDRNVYSREYFDFVRTLFELGIGTGSIVAGAEEGGSSSSSDATPAAVETRLAVLQAAVKFFFNTYLHTKETLRTDVKQWESRLLLAFSGKPESTWFVNFLSAEGSCYLVPLLLSCPIKEVRELLYKLILQACRTVLAGLLADAVPLATLNSFIGRLLSLLQQDVVENVKTCSEFFTFFCDYAQSGAESCCQLLELGACRELLYFLIPSAKPTVPAVSTATSSSSSEAQDTTLPPRRFTSVQGRELGPLHGTLAWFTLHSDLASTRDSPCRQSQLHILTLRAQPKPQAPLSDDVKLMLFGSATPLYLNEVMFALREVGVSGSADMLLVIDSLVYASYNNSALTHSVIAAVRQQLANVPSNELRGVFRLAGQLLLIADEYQELRHRELLMNPVDGALRIVRNNSDADSQRSYRLIKFLVDVTARSDASAQFLRLHQDDWQWAVEWLRKRMLAGGKSLPSSTALPFSSSSSSHTGQLSSLDSGSTAASNENLTGRAFQRTVSAQFTLERATALLPSSAHGSSSDMEVESNGESSPMDLFASGF